ncbi:MAG: Ig-like domain-containing protein [Bacilli bacterium]|nr:Ig-like domain-containing protein [Bacilli bacterium]
MKKIYILISILIIIFLSLGLIGYIHNYNYSIVPNVIVKSLSITNNVINVKFDLSKKSFYEEVYYIYKNDDVYPLADDKGWIKASGNSFDIKIDNSIYYIYLKNENDDIYFVDGSNKLGNVSKVNVSKDKVYLAKGGVYSVNANYESVGYVSDSINWRSENESIAKVDNNGKITGVKAGNTKVIASIGGKESYVDVVVSNLIVKAPKKFNRNKKYLPCEKYSKSENDLLDTILKDRVTDAGYKTRAGAVEAARFLTLEFPYKIRYFSENGRLSINKVDGEGRYYHEGLYLHKSRYEDISKSMHGPKIWGCSLYSNPSKGKRSNGLDCSGFVSWVLKNGGFNPGDIGAGIMATKDLTDLGKRISFNASVVKSGKVKTGDLLSSGGYSGGHIAIIVGQDENYYYVAESLWNSPNVAVVIMPYSKKTIFNRYYYVMLMDSYYKEDGKLTDLWY